MEQIVDLIKDHMKEIVKAMKKQAKGTEGTMVELHTTQIKPFVLTRLFPMSFLHARQHFSACPTQ